MDAWLIPAESVNFSEEIRKSRFITLLAHTDGVEAARALVRQAREQHPAARHHCWAWVAGSPQDSQQLGFSDDGEPSGTAGKPMLAQLMGSGVGEVTAVVVRYYGGIQLGTGGLVKAYGGGVQQALKQLKLQEKVRRTAFRLCCDYALLAQVEALVLRMGGEVTNGDYGVDVTLDVMIPASLANEARQRLLDMSRGTLHLQPV
ncbi:IMPACT family protein [Affinibrenneria salicis]|uniref:IMPACT family protein n=1 Tax=Affinibrenneria salicis TaxID=2590031 RepID=A0A5J5FUQ4_9GAMM|nr:IMPACT family protein [Affinibrenneria salicis]KAA8997259.1 IMPACT family protein [Affinibrenneria salicis]